MASCKRVGLTVAGGAMGITREQGSYQVHGQKCGVRVNSKGAGLTAKGQG